jgi:hypothetical protein
LRSEFGVDAAARKLALLGALERAHLASAADVARLHDILCFLRAFPDDQVVREQAARMLERFDRRRDLREHRGALENSGIAGTTIRDRFYWHPARWLAARWGDRLTIDWNEFDSAERLEALLPRLALYSETPALDQLDLRPRAWIRRMKSPSETDAAFLVRRLDAIDASAELRESLYDDLDPTLALKAGPDTPARTREVVRRSPLHYQTAPLERALRSARAEALRPPERIRDASPGEARALIELARTAMVTRRRDLDAFQHADARDLRIAACGRGLEIVCAGVIPERRLLLEALYGYLILKNGVVVGYGTGSALFGSVEIAYNVFEAYRGAEAGVMFGRVLGTFRALLGADTFTLDPYQIGADNTEALQSGAWWFYQKQGFLPRDRGALRLMREERRALRANAAHRSSIATLRRLAAHPLFLDLARPRDEVLGVFPLGDIGLAATRLLAERFGAEREAGARLCAREAGRLLGASGRARGAGPSAGASAPRGWSAGERLAWERWAPLVVALPRVDRWTPDAKRALVAVIRAKGGPRESDFVTRFDRHTELRRSLHALLRGRNE